MQGGDAEAALLASFFERPWDANTCHLRRKVERLLLFRCAGFSLATLGRFDEGLPLLREALKGANKIGDAYTAAITARNLANFLIRIGELSEAEQILTGNLHHAEQSSDKFMPVGFRCSLGYARLLQFGPVASVAETFALAWDWNSRRGRDASTPELPNFHYLMFLIARGDARLALSRLDELETRPSGGLTPFGRALFAVGRIVASAAAGHWDVANGLLNSEQSAVWQAGRSDVIGLWHLASADIALHLLVHAPVNPQLSERARASLEEAIEIARRDQFIPLHVECLRLRAKLRVLQGDTGGGRSDLDDTWNIVEPRRMQLDLADVHLNRARLFFRDSPYPWTSPQADLAAAEKLIIDCNYHRRHEEIAEAKRAIVHH